MRLLSDTLAVLPSTANSPFNASLPIDPLPNSLHNWQPLADVDLTIFVGLTGVGKTTTLEAVADLGFTLTLLPNRRTLTDDLLIAELQLADGDPVSTVRDRAQRFAYTRRYRERYAGGMARALAQLLLKRNVPTINVSAANISTTIDTVDVRYLFDGLRGVNEVTHAARLLPRARFVVLTASDFVRVQRLLGRNDQFDQVAVSDKQIEAVDLLGEAASLFSAKEQEQLYALVQAGQVDPAELQAKLKIVQTERQNYDSDASIDALLSVAPQRTLVVDTATYSPQQVAEQIVTFLQSI